MIAFASFLGIGEFLLVVVFKTDPEKIGTVAAFTFGLQLALASICFSWARNCGDEKKKSDQISYIGENLVYISLAYLLSTTFLLFDKYGALQQYRKIHNVAVFFGYVGKGLFLSAFMITAYIYYLIFRVFIYAEDYE